jgi:hypothetical protein
MASFKTCTALAFAAVALAATAPNRPPPIKVNAQIGRVHVPVTCDFLNAYNQTFEVVASGGLAAYGVHGGSYYVTDIAGNVTIPDEVLRLARLSGATQITQNTSIYLDSTNAAPARLLMYNGISTLKVPASGSIDSRFPVGNGTLPPVGPYVIGSGSEPSRVVIGDVHVTITLQNAEGKTIGGELAVNCARPPVDIILGGVSILDAQAAKGVLGSAINSVPKNGYVPDFGNVPLNDQYGFFRFPYGCDFGALGAEQLDLTIGGQLPTVLIPGEKFSLSRAQSYLRVPPSIIALAKKGFPTASKLALDVSAFDLFFSNASPASINVASPTHLKSTVDISHASNKTALVIPIPEFNSLKVGPITVANKVGDVMSLSVGNATAAVSLLDNSGKSLYDFNVHCQPYAFLELIGVSIAEQLPLNYSLGTVEPSTPSQ